MKRNLFLLFLSFFLFSCQKEEFDLEKEDVVLTTRSSVLSSPLSELNGIPVNIKLVDEPSYPFLSAQSSGINVNLYSSDDGSLRQRWNFKAGFGMNGVPVYDISILGGTKYNNTVISTNGVPPNKVTPSIGSPGSNIPTMLHAQNIPNTNFYYIYREMSPTPMGWLTPYYLHSEKAKGRDLRFSEKNSTGGRDRWEIVPVGNFEIVSISYNMETGDKLDYTPEQIKTFTVPNTTNPNPVTHEYDEIEEITETSNFSETHGLSMTNKIGITRDIGIPLIVNGKLSEETTRTSSFSYTQGNTQSIKKQIRIKFSTQIPPYANGFIKVYVAKYTLNVTYTATLRSTSTGKTFKVSGKWKGVVATDYYYEPIISYN